MTKDRQFYRTFFYLLFFVGMQNLVAYSVNMADNIMLGSYSQQALSGAATVNQIQFLVQQFCIGIGDALVTITAQYWGQRKIDPIRRLTGLALICGLGVGMAVTALVWAAPRQVLGLFTNDTGIIEAGTEYLSIIRYTYIPFILTSIMLAALRSVGSVNMAFLVSCLSLVVNVGINYTLIFGNFGFPEMGIRGAAVGTLVARLLELFIVTGYLLLRDKRLKLFEGKLFGFGRELAGDFARIALPILIANFVWAISIPIQTVILGHLSGDAIAANSVSSTLFQYLKVITVSEASAMSVLIGKAIGEGDKEKVISYAKTMQVCSIFIGLILGALLFFLRRPILSFYALNDTALKLADQLIILMSVIMVGMAYQMPVGSGIIRGGGDAKFSMYVNLISVWVIVMPLTLLCAYYWKLSVPVIVAALNSDQVFKCIPIGIRVNRYKWIRKLTR